MMKKIAGTPPQPKFCQGQVVMVKFGRKVLPFKILHIIFESGEWFYKWNKRNYAAEHMLRELDAIETGIVGMPYDAERKSL